VKIPPSAGQAVANPDGIVWNPNPNQFVITSASGTGGAVFIFVGEDGTLTAWNPVVDPIVAGKSTATLVLDNGNGGNGAVYKGLAYGTNVHGNFIFATNFRAATVEVYNTAFKLTKLDGSFTDPNLPAGFAPFGISNIDGDLFVTYAQQDGPKHDPVVGDGLGFVDVFSTDGVFIRRFASRGVLNAPWGVVRATEGFGKFAGDVLIGNFGNNGHFGGWINAYDNHGHFLGELRSPQGKPISIDGLWSLYFGTFAVSTATRSISPPVPTTSSTASSARSRRSAPPRRWPNTERKRQTSGVAPARGRHPSGLQSDKRNNKSRGSGAVQHERARRASTKFTDD